MHPTYQGTWQQQTHATVNHKSIEYKSVHPHWHIPQHKHSHDIHRQHLVYAVIILLVYREDI